jgi:DNA-binding winged helix-turn-helix (wHTH) protein/tetratricopeptide (TPR) repeat protein
MEAAFHVGPWLVEPSLNSISRDGITLHLEPKVMEVLVCLAEHAGQPLSKEQLIQFVWADTFVTDDVLKRCISELRRAFEDDAREPRIIETIPKRGYRFIAPVTSDGHKAVATKSAAVSHPSGWKVAVPVALVLSAGLLATGLFWRWRQPRHLTEKDTVVLGDFANSTGDAVFDVTLRQGLAVQLEQSPFLKLLSEEQIRQTLRMMSQKSNVRLTSEVAREVCQRTNSSVALDGSIALIGTRYDVILSAVDCANGDLLASAEAQANDKSHVLDAVSSVASQMRGKLGESLGTVQKYNTPLAQATTPSLEALQAYSQGLQTVREAGDFAGAVSFFQRATELDPNFAMAYLNLGDAYETLGDTPSTAKHLRKAFELRAGVSELERLTIEGAFYVDVTGDLTKARRAFESRAKMNPDSHYAHIMLAVCSNVLGEYEAALREYKDALSLSPRNSILYRHTAFTYLLMDRVEDAAAVAKEAQVKGLDSDLAPVLYSSAFYRGDTAEMGRQLANGVGKRGQQELLSALEADTAAYFGHLEKARELSRRAADSAERVGEKETAGEYYAVSALREALFGNAYNARQQAAAAKQRSTGRDASYSLALAYAYAGDTRTSEALAEDLGKNFPEDTVIQFNYLPTVRAKLAIGHSNLQRAIDVLETSAPYELGLPAYSFYNWPNLYPVYVRGEAFLAAHRGREAAAEFQKILDHRGIVLNEPIGALAHLQVARAYVLQGDTNKARAAYQDFLTLWKDADPDIPILRQAKAEDAKLRHKPLVVSKFQKTSRFAKVRSRAVSGTLEHTLIISEWSAIWK